MFRVSPLEIVLILIVVLIIFGATKMTQIGQKISGSSRSKASETESRNLPPKELTSPHPRLQLLGIITVIAGVIVLGIGLAIMKAIAPVAIWGGVIIAIGVTIFILSRRKV
jgi:hypothetical protein